MASKTPTAAERVTDSSGNVIDNAKSGKLGEFSKFNASFLMTSPDPNITKFDPNGNTPSAILSQIQKITTSKINNLFKFVSNLKIGGFGLTELLDYVDFKDGFKVDVEGLGKRLGGYVGGALELASDIKEIVDDVKNDALGALQKYAGALGPLGSYIQDGVNIYHIAKDTDWKDINSLLSATSQIFGTDLLGKFVDVGATTAWVSALASKAQELGLPQLIDKLKDKVQDYVSFRNKLSDGARDNAVAGDTKTLNYLTTIMERETILSRNPDIVEVLLSNYSFPDGYTYDKFPEYRAELITTMNRLNPHWDKELFNNKWISSLIPWVKASSDARILFSETEYQIPIMLAQDYPEVTITSLLKEQYPHYYY